MAKIHLINEVPIELLIKFLNSDDRGVIITIKVKPNSSKEKLSLSGDGRLLLSVSGAAIKGMANMRVMELLSDLFVVPKTKIEILSGHKSKINRILIAGEKIEKILSDNNM